MQVKQRLDALTSLRFFAVVIVVFQHSEGLFGLAQGQPFRIFPILGQQAVSFFFVLSGFILAYIYPKLETWSERRRFWRARIARIWPGATIILAVWLFIQPWDYKAALANFFMINAWIPYSQYNFSYNLPSWSISTEFFFYLAFPFLIHQWEKTGLLKLLVSGMIVALLIIVSTALQFPSQNNSITLGGLLYFNPISRIFEFILGICIAFYWRKQVNVIQWSESHATIIEIGVIVLTGASMHFLIPVAAWVNQIVKWPALDVWLTGSGSLFAFGLFIYVIAMGRGRISAWLSHPLLVLLGEISFSLYLLHYYFLAYYRTYIDLFPVLPNPLLLTIFWSFILLSSYLMWALVEMPCRRLILGREKGRIHGTKVMRESWHSHLNLNPKTFSSAIVLICLVSSIYFSMENNPNRLTESEADETTPNELRSVVGTRFGNLFMLRGIRVVHEHEGLTLYLAWESLVEQDLTSTTRIYLTDVDGNDLLTVSAKQPKTRSAEKPGAIWGETILIPSDKLRGLESKLAIAVYQVGGAPLHVDRGDRDRDEHRLLIDF